MAIEATLAGTMWNTECQEFTGAIQRIDASGSRVETVRIFRSVLEQYGFSDFLITGLPVAHDASWPRSIICDGWPREWYQRYLREEHFLHDPCVARSRHASRPFFWHHVGRAGMKKTSHRVMNEASEFGLKDGICVPIHVPLAGPAVVSAAGERIEVPVHMLPFIEMLCVHTFRALSDFENEQRHAGPQHLTPREREVLQWSAAGKTAEDIGTILNITRNTVESHHRHIRDKLDATNLVHAVAKAARLYEIEI